MQLARSFLIFVITTVSVGTLISTIYRNQQQAMLGGFLFPAVLMSGIMFPVENIPGFFITAAYPAPLMYFVRLLRNRQLTARSRTGRWGEKHL